MNIREQRMDARVRAAIATVEYSRQTHVEWAAYLRGNPSYEPGALGNAVYHEQCVREYDNVLAVLRQGCEYRDDVERDLAAALAAEREKARAPFLALADELSAEAVTLPVHIERSVAALRLYDALRAAQCVASSTTA